MLTINQKIPPFLPPAITQETLTLFNCANHNHPWLSLYIVLPLRAPEAASLDRHNDNGVHKETLPLTTCPNAETFHTSWIRQTPTLRTSVPADPLSRLHRPRSLFRASAQAQCCSVLIDPPGALKAHLNHHPNDLRMNSLKEALTTNHRLPRPLPQETSFSCNKGASTSCIL